MINQLGTWLEGSAVSGIGSPCCQPLAARPWLLSLCRMRVSACVPLGARSLVYPELADWGGALSVCTWQRACPTESGLLSAGAGNGLHTRQSHCAMRMQCMHDDQNPTHQGQQNWAALQGSLLAAAGAGSAALGACQPSDPEHALSGRSAPWCGRRSSPALIACRQA